MFLEVYPQVLGISTLKRCSKCGEYKSHDHFTIDKGRKDGHYHTCRTCLAEYRRQYRQQKPDILKAQSAKDRAKNKERKREYHRDLYQREKQRINKRNKDWYYANRAKRLSSISQYKKTERGHESRILENHRRRVLVTSDDVSRDDLQLIRASQTDKRGRLICWACGKPITGNEPPPHLPNGARLPPHLDHWMPLKHGGPHVPGNLHYMHGLCNLEKGSKLPEEIGRLL